MDTPRDILLDHIPRIRAIADTVLNGYHPSFETGIDIVHGANPDSYGSFLNLVIHIKLREEEGSFEEQMNKEFLVKEIIRNAFPGWDYVEFKYLK